MAVVATGPVLLHGDVLFNVTPRDPRRLVQPLVIRIELTNLAVRLGEPLASITSVRGLWIIITQ